MKQNEELYEEELIVEELQYYGQHDRNIENQKGVKSEILQVGNSKLKMDFDVACQSGHITIETECQTDDDVNEEEEHISAQIDAEENSEMMINKKDYSDKEVQIEMQIHSSLSKSMNIQIGHPCLNESVDVGCQSRIYTIDAEMCTDIMELMVSSQQSMNEQATPAIDEMIDEEFQHGNLIEQSRKITKDFKSKKFQVGNSKLDQDFEQSCQTDLVITNSESQTEYNIDEEDKIDAMISGQECCETITFDKEFADGEILTHNEVTLTSDTTIQVGYSHVNELFEVACQTEINVYQREVQTDVDSEFWIDNPPIREDTPLIQEDMINESIQHPENLNRLTSSKKVFKHKKFQVGNARLAQDIDASYQTDCHTIDLECQTEQIEFLDDSITAQIEKSEAKANLPLETLLVNREIFPCVEVHRPSTKTFKVQVGYPHLNELLDVASQTRNVPNNSETQTDIDEIIIINNRTMKQNEELYEEELIVEEFQYYGEHDRNIENQETCDKNEIVMDNYVKNLKSRFRSQEEMIQKKIGPLHHDNYCLDISFDDDFVVESITRRSIVTTKREIVPLLSCNISKNTEELTKFFSPKKPLSNTKTQCQFEDNEALTNVSQAYNLYNQCRHDNDCVKDKSVQVSNIDGPFEQLFGNGRTPSTLSIGNQTEPKLIKSIKAQYFPDNLQNVAIQVDQFNEQTFHLPETDDILNYDSVFVPINEGRLTCPRQVPLFPMSQRSIDGERSRIESVISPPISDTGIQTLHSPESHSVSIQIIPKGIPFAQSETIFLNYFEHDRTNIIDSLSEELLNKTEVNVINESITSTSRYFDIHTSFQLQCQDNSECTINESKSKVTSTTDTIPPSSNVGYFDIDLTPKLFSNNSNDFDLKLRPEEQSKNRKRCYPAHNNACLEISFDDDYIVERTKIRSIVTTKREVLPIPSYNISKNTEELISFFSNKNTLSDSTTQCEHNDNETLKNESQMLTNIYLNLNYVKEKSGGLFESPSTGRATEYQQIPEISLIDSTKFNSINSQYTSETRSDYSTQTMDHMEQFDEQIHRTNFPRYESMSDKILKQSKPYSAFNIPKKTRNVPSQTSIFEKPQMFLQVDSGHSFLVFNNIVMVTSVYDHISSKNMSLVEAIDNKIIDLENDAYKISEYQFTTIEKAINAKFIR